MNVKFIAEVFSNHSQDLERCLDFIDCSAEIFPLLMAGRGNQFKVTVYRSHDPEIAGLTQIKGVSETVCPKASIVKLLRNGPKASYENLAKQMDVSTSTIKRLLQELKNEGKIERIGSKRGGAWKVLP
jgi:predicted HTH transcriptional regulator